MKYFGKSGMLDHRTGRSHDDSLSTYYETWLPISVLIGATEYLDPNQHCTPLLFDLLRIFQEFLLSR